MRGNDSDRLTGLTNYSARIDDYHDRALSQKYRGNKNAPRSRRTLGPRSCRATPRADNARTHKGENKINRDVFVGFRSFFKLTFYGF